MYIYFEDGTLKDTDIVVNEICAHELKKITSEMIYKIDAGEGFTHCSTSIKNLYAQSKKKNSECTIIVYTNSLACLSNTVCWNHETNQCDLILRDKLTGEWHRAQDYTEKEIREGHNLMAMVMNGVFDGPVIIKELSEAEKNDTQMIYTKLRRRRNAGEKLSTDEKMKLLSLKLMMYSHYGATGGKDE